MKNSLLIKQIAIIFISIHLYTSVLNAQEISGVEIYPENITSNDEVLLIISTSFPFLDCTLDSVNTFYACNAFAFDGFYNTAFTTGDCERTDTISLGMLSDGLYMISYRMYYLGWSQVDQADTSITVGTTGIEHLTEQKADAVTIWPNPSPGHVNIAIEDENIDRLVISNVHGSLSKEIIIPKETRKIHNELSLSPGMYICTAFRNHQPYSTTRFIVVQ